MMCSFSLRPNRGSAEMVGVLFDGFSKMLLPAAAQGMAAKDRERETPQQLHNTDAV